MAKTPRKTAKSARKTAKTRGGQKGLAAMTSRLVKIRTQPTTELPKDIDDYVEKLFERKRTHLLKFCGSSKASKFLIVRVPSLTK